MRRSDMGRIEKGGISTISPEYFVQERTNRSAATKPAVTGFWSGSASPGMIRSRAGVFVLLIATTFMIIAELETFMWWYSIRTGSPDLRPATNNRIGFFTDSGLFEYQSSASLR